MKLKSLDKETLTRKTIAKKYSEGINNKIIQLPRWNKQSEDQCFIYTLLGVKETN